MSNQPESSVIALALMLQSTFQDTPMQFATGHALAEALRAETAEQRPLGLVLSNDLLAHLRGNQPDHWLFSMFDPTSSTELLRIGRLGTVFGTPTYWTNVLQGHALAVIRQCDAEGRPTSNPNATIYQLSL